ncbi:MAG: hypothetical protein WC501_00015 [Candidatus Micrarchaeia archaeon]
MQKFSRIGSNGGLGKNQTMANGGISPLAEQMSSAMRRLGKSNPELDKKRDLAELFNYLTRTMEGLDFRYITSNAIDQKLKNAGLLEAETYTGVVKENELIFNRGIGNWKSNFFVFVKAVYGTADLDDRIEILFCNPMKGAGAFFLQADQIFVKKILKSGDSYNEVSKIINEIHQTAVLKEDDDFRMQTHIHSLEIFEGRYKLFDDGVSRIEDVIRKLMLNNTDMWSLTPHNYSDSRVHRMMELISEELGMTYIPGMELTMTLGKYNGPHMVVMCDSRETMEEIEDKILNMRDKTDMPPLFPGKMKFHEMFKILYEIKLRKRLSLFIPHCIIYDSEVYDTQLIGLFIAANTEEFNLAKALGYGRRCTAIATHNNLASNIEIWGKIGDRELEGFLELLIKKRFGKNARKIKISSNLATHLIARAMEEIYHLNSYTETDAHSTAPIDNRLFGGYDVFGTDFAHGFTQIDLREILEKLKGENRKITALELIKSLETGKIRTASVVFEQFTKDGKLEIAKARTKKSFYGTVSKIALETYRYMRYSWYMIKTFFNDFGWGKIGRYDK